MVCAVVWLDLLLLTLVIVLVGFCCSVGSLLVMWFDACV